jgi:hypothetical protein
MYAFLPCVSLLVVACLTVWIELLGSNSSLRFIPLLLLPSLAVTCHIALAAYDHFEIYGTGHVYFLFGNLTWALLFAVCVLHWYYLYMALRRNTERRCKPSVQAPESGEPSREPEHAIGRF